MVFKTRLPIINTFLISSLCYLTHADQKPSPVDLSKAEAEVKQYYHSAKQDVQDTVIHYAKWGQESGFWLNQDAFSHLTSEERERKIKNTTNLLDEEYDYVSPNALAEASALQDQRLVPGLMRIAGYDLDGKHDNQVRWMAVAALARQDTKEDVPLLIQLVEHYNRDTQYWARAALARKTSQDFGKDTETWTQWWEEEKGNQASQSRANDPEPRELIEARARYEQKLKEISEPLSIKYIQHLEALKSTLIQQDDLVGAQAVKNEIELVQESINE